MIETNKVPEFTSKFENLTIHISEMIVEQFVSIMNSNLPKDTAYSNIWQDTNSSFIGDELDLRGKIHLYLKNQRDHDMASLFFTITFRVKAEHDIDAANVFTKFVEYLFGWIKEYVKKDSLLGKDGNPFIVPEFPYSRSHFETFFQVKLPLYDTFNYLIVESSLQHERIHNTNQVTIYLPVGFGSPFLDHGDLNREEYMERINSRTFTGILV